MLLLGKRGVGTTVVTQNLTFFSRTPAARNVGSFIFMCTSNELDLERISKILGAYGSLTKFIPNLGGNGLGLLANSFSDA
jgi:hypothetical protein